MRTNLHDVRFPKNDSHKSAVKFCKRGVPRLVQFNSCDAHWRARSTNSRLPSPRNRFRKNRFSLIAFVLNLRLSSLAASCVYAQHVCNPAIPRLLITNLQLNARHRQLMSIVSIPCLRIQTEQAVDRYGTGMGIHAGQFIILTFCIQQGKAVYVYATLAAPF